MISDMTAKEFYFAGLRWPEDQYTPEIAAALVATEEPWWLYAAGGDWSAARYTPEIATALIATGDVKALSAARRFWPEDRKADLEVSND